VRARTRASAAALAGMALVQPAYAVQYHTVAQVRVLLFPAATGFRDASVLLSQAQRQAVAGSAGVEVSGARVHAWEARAGERVLGYLMLDEVTGKHDQIGYALALSPEGKIEAVEIMDYRETYGDQVRQPHWRAQFVGKGGADPLRLERDIRNISGATLSCSHVTDGVRRLVAVFDQVIRQRSVPLANR
jgi:Na+-translocating ferredoxin:NAD+ oxidoreductase RnfG subunit